MKKIVIDNELVEWLEFTELMHLIEQFIVLSRSRGIGFEVYSLAFQMLRIKYTAYSLIMFGRPKG